MEEVLLPSPWPGSPSQGIPVALSFEWVFGSDWWWGVWTIDLHRLGARGGFGIPGIFWECGNRDHMESLGLGSARFMVRFGSRRPTPLDLTWETLSSWEPVSGGQMDGSKKWF